MTQQEKILVVDDNLINITIIKELLSDSYQLETAMSGEEALEVAARFRPDLVLLDIMMPGIDGFEVCRKLRMDPVLRRTKVIMISAKTQLSDRIEGYEAGADDYLTKPFEEAEFLAKVKVYLRLKSVEEVEHLKDDILTLIRHEAFTPLNGIMMSAEILKQGESDADEVRDLAEIIVESADKLNSFMNKMLTYSALKSGNCTLDKVEASLSSLITNGCQKNETAIKTKQLILTTAIPSDLTIKIDIHQVEASVTAILDNAIRFSPENSEIKIHATQEESCIVLTIEDLGPGIDKEKLLNIFEPFHDMDVLHHTEGHGLSLAMTQLIMELHGGSIQITSPAKDEKGTSVSLRFPRV